ncbi:MAG: ABC transporter substrate-binding protein [Frankia sp.]
MLWAALDTITRPDVGTSGHRGGDRTHRLLRVRQPDGGFGQRVFGPGRQPWQVSLGVIFPNSGTNSSSFDAYRAGVDARLGVANASGGVNGRKISYHWADDGSLNASNLAAAQELVHRNVFSIEEISTASAGGAAWLHAQQVPVVGTAVDPVWSIPQHAQL